MVQNLVLNNSDHNFSAINDQLRAQTDRPEVVATPGTDAAIVAQLRGQLEAGTLTSSGSGINVNAAA